MVAQVGFVGEGEFGQVAKALNVGGSNAQFLEFLAVKGDAVINVLGEFDQTLTLQSF